MEKSAKYLVDNINFHGENSFSIRIDIDSFVERDLHLTGKD